jgi:hypothetical protein
MPKEESEQRNFLWNYEEETLIQPKKSNPEDREGPQIDQDHQEDPKDHPEDQIDRPQTQEQMLSN